VARSTDIHLCYDLGGTKLRAALISAQGRISATAEKPIDQTLGLPGLLADFRELAKEMSAKKFKMVSVASAGPLHSGKGILLDPTNFFTGEKSWGIIPIAAHLKKIFKRPVLIDNDAAAAVMGEAWKGGHGKARDNLIAITLGTGVGIGVITNGAVVRAGRGLHPEASHIPINSEDRSRPCGCGAYGCIEAYLSGMHFARIVSEALGRTVDGYAITGLAQQGDRKVLDLFAEYGRHLAQAIRSLAVVFAPEVVVLGGGFSEAAPYFLPTAEAALPALLERYRQGFDLVPKVKVSKLGESIGVLGAAFMAAHK